MRVLVAISPSMYREVIALAIRQHRPDLEVRIVPPERIEGEVRRFRPHLLVRNVTDGLDGALLAEVRCWVEVIYSDSMDARISVDGRVSEANNASLEDLLAVVDEAAGLSP